MGRPATSFERLAPGGVVVVVVALAVAVLLLLSSATSRGRQALEELLVSEVAAVARNQDQRLAQGLGSTAGLANQDYELTVGSADDRAALEELASLVPDLRSGFFLLDANGTITQGVNFLEGDDAVGRPYERAGFDALAGSPGYAQGVGGVLDIAEGITTTSPNYAIAFPILDPQTGRLRGSLVFEAEVSPDSSLNEEIANLGKGGTGRYLLYDRNGVVVAASDPSLFDEPISDRELLTAPTGLLEGDLHGDVVVIADVPTAGWRIAYRQERDEFEAGLAGPIEAVGVVLVVAILAGGAVAAVLLLHRLRAAREEHERLRRLAESQEEFVSIVSHELRTPVAGVLGFLQTTIDHWDGMTDAERQAALRRAAANARRLQALARDVLDSETLAAGRMSFAFADVDLAEEVRDAVEAFRSVVADRTVEVVVPDGPVPVRADADRIQQVLSNLFDNAAQNSPAPEPITVTLGIDGADADAVVTVTDRGAGVPADVAGRIFERFVRGRADRVGGTGLGLYIVRNIVEAHGGTVAVDSAPGETTFTVRLPRHPPSAAAASA